MFQFKHRLTSDRLRNRAPHHLAVVRMDIPVQPAAARIRSIGNEIPALQLPHFAPVRTHLVNHIGRGRHERPEPLLAPFDLLAIAHLRRNILEITHHAEPPVGKRYTVDPPCVMFRSFPVDPPGAVLQLSIRFTGLERMAEPPHQFIGGFPGPQPVYHLVEIAPNQIRDVTENRRRLRVGLPDTEVRIHQVHSQRRCVEQRFELRARLISYPPQLQSRFHPRQQFVAAERLHQIIVRPRRHAFNAALLAGPRGQQNHRNVAQTGVGPQRLQQSVAVQLRHHHVRENQGRRVGARGFQSGLAIPHRLHIVPVAQQPAHIRAHVRVVIRPKNPRHLRRP